MKLSHAWTEVVSKESLFGRDKSRQAVEWVVDCETKPNPMLLDHCSYGEGYSSLYSPSGDFRGGYLPSFGLND
jgi:hypothetical protein